MKKANKIISLLISAALLLPISATVFATENLRFSDVSQENWFYESVTEMTKKGYFSGKGDIVNGVGIFAPNDTMTKAEFMTVAARIAFGNAINTDSAAEWWRPYYDALIGAKIIYEINFPISTVNEGISRAEAAYITVALTQYSGEKYDVNIAEAYKSIPDIKYAAFCEEISMAYAKGIVTGVDEQGTYKPQGTLTRAEGTTILLRAISPEYRIERNYEAPPHWTYTTHWVYPPIDAAATEAMSNGTYKPYIIPVTELVLDYNGDLER